MLLYKVNNKNSKEYMCDCGSVTSREFLKKSKYGREKPRDKFNTLTSVLSSTHHVKHQVYDFTRTFAKLRKP